MSLQPSQALLAGTKTTSASETERRIHWIRIHVTYISLPQVCEMVQAILRCLCCLQQCSLGPSEGREVSGSSVDSLESPGVH